MNRTPAVPTGAIAVVGLGYGDEGKGSCVDYFVRTTGAQWVVRFNGGPQAAHHVVSPSGQTHCFAQFGSGTLVAGVRTWLAHPMMLDPLALAKEQLALQRLGIHDAYTRLHIDPNCVVITPFHALLNRLRETLRGAARHGSCGMGIGEAWQDLARPGFPVLRWRDLAELATLAPTLATIQADKIAQAEALLATAETEASGAAAQAYLADLRLRHLPTDLAHTYHHLFHTSGITTAGAECLTLALAQQQAVIFEGAQGVLLDKELGFWPYVTPANTTFAPAAAVLAEIPGAGSLLRVGVVRAYSVRHGPGPMVSEDAALTNSLPDQHNGLSPWQGAMRVGWFDAVMTRYALQAVGGVDRLALTNVDRLAGRARLQVCEAYQHTNAATVRTVPLAADPAAQGQLTAWLANCRPQWQRLPGWTNVTPTHQPAAFLAYCAHLEASLATPIGWCSAGPTACDKWAFASPKY